MDEEEFNVVKKAIRHFTGKYPEFRPKKGWVPEMAAIAKDCSDISIGEPPLDFNVFSSFFYTHNFYRKVIGEDETSRTVCLMCWKKDKTPTLYKTIDGNAKGMKDHLASKLLNMLNLCKNM